VEAADLAEAEGAVERKARFLFAGDAADEHVVAEIARPSDEVFDRRSAIVPGSSWNVHVERGT